MPIPLVRGIGLQQTAAIARGTAQLLSRQARVSASAQKLGCSAITHEKFGLLSPGRGSGFFTAARPSGNTFL
jgi:hypothetical protein